jgi:AraC-like DNA-binding protein
MLSMDVLSQILDSVEMRGSLYFATEYTAPWALQVDANTNVCRFHVVVEGSCHLTVGNQRASLSRGDLVLVPHGAAHALLDDPETPPVELARALAASRYEEEGLFRWGGGGDRCRLVCGHFEFDQEATHPLLVGLPALVHVQATPTYNFRWIDQVMQFIGEETHSRRAGSDAIARRLSEVLFVQVMRHFAETEPQALPILAGLTDERLSRALHAMHTRPEHSWTLEELAQEAGMSRTAFALTFAELVGLTPMKYLTDQRMRQAAKLLKAGESIGAVADRVGYRSEAAFSRKFKQLTGTSPGAFRRGLQTGSAAVAG